MNLNELIDFVNKKSKLFIFFLISFMYFQFHEILKVWKLLTAFQKRVKN